MTNRISRVQTPMPETGLNHAAAIMGYACRLPGAPTVDAFWSLLRARQCAVTEIDPDRWAKERFLHPHPGEPGRTYTFAAGVLPDIYAFDPGAFGLSPREVEQVDPQQRILLELTREAFENANMPLSELEGERVGVFVGASSLDYSVRFAADVSSVDPHFVTGNALSIISNRISFAFGFTGPSLTIDTACSSSLVAFDRAVRAIESGEVDVAVVAGVNILAAPYNFVGFARAGMLSPTGRCRPFSAQADGYVRSEGAVVMVLRRLASATQALQAPRAVVMGTGTNSDGRTVGIALPNSDAQRALIETVYAARGIDPERLAFVEAHGTGTRVGDPAEANAIGNAIGLRRSTPLPIGSVKSNLGHLEPASGLAGLLKALLALEHRLLPASLHLHEPNETIPFAALNLAPAQEEVPLTVDTADLAAVSSFGFGGTNAHAVVRRPRADELPPAAAAVGEEPGPQALLLSASSRQSLVELASAYAQALAQGADGARLAHATAYGRSLLPHRLAVPLSGGVPAAEALRRFAAEQPEPGIASGIADRPQKIAFVFAGNGGQHVGMGRAAYLANASFRASIQRIDALFAPLAGWSLADAITAPASQERLNATEVAQPLLFAIGVGIAEVLMAHGCQPCAILGHSVGEIPAAYVAGALDLKEAVELIYWRSKLQEATRGSGSMAVLMAAPDDAAPLLTKDVVIAAINSPSVVTIAGPSAEVDAILRRARKAGIAGKRMDLDYPFHSPLMAPVEAPLKEALAGLHPRTGALPYFSTVTGARFDTAGLDADYWWHNVREPVRFAEAVTQAAEQEKADIFLEIGPRPVLTGHMRETLEPLLGAQVVLSTLQEKAPAHRDPVLHTLLSCAVEGAPFDRGSLFGARRPLGAIQLPLTPWQRQTIVVPPTTEAVDTGGSRPLHPLLGGRLKADSREWSGLLDAQLVPYLADHKVNDTVVVPGTALAEMALAAGRELFGEGPLALEEFDILHALTLNDEGARETLVRVSAGGEVEILSRPRFTVDWSLHARGHIGPSASTRAAKTLAARADDQGMRCLAAEDLYAAAALMGLNYGPQFRLVTSAEARHGRISLTLAPEAADQGAYRLPHVLHPTVLDASLHGLLLAVDEQAFAEHRVYLPARFGALHVFGGGPVVRAELEVVRASRRSLLLDIQLFDADDVLVARLDHARLRAAVLSNQAALETDYRQHLERLPQPIAQVAVVEAAEAAFAALDQDDVASSDDFILLSAFATALAHEAVTAVQSAAGATGEIDPETLVSDGYVADESRALLLTLLHILAAAGLAQRQGQIWSVNADSGLPASASILGEVLADCPDRAAEVTLGARLAEALADTLRSGAPLALTAALVDHWQTASPAARALETVARTVVDAIGNDAEPPRVLVVERHGALALSLLPLAERGLIRLAVDGADTATREALAARHPALAPLLAASGEAAPGHDLVLCADLYGLIADNEALATRLGTLVTPGGVLCALQIQANPLATLLAAADHDGTSPIAPIAETARRLASRGFLAIKTSRAGTPRAPVEALMARAPLPDEEVPAAATAPLARSIEELLTLSGASLAVTLRGQDAQPQAHLLDAATAPADWEAPLSPAEGTRTLIVHPLMPAPTPDAMADALLRATQLLERVRAAGAGAEVWFLTRGGAPVEGSPEASAAWGFGRVAMNEFADIDLRLLDLAPALDAATAGASLAALMIAPPDERELSADDTGLQAVRTTIGPEAAATRASTASSGADHMALLEARPGSMDRLTWIGVPRRTLAAGEVEIEVAASALNFRDVMFAQGVIGDEMLENGFTGPSLGFECAGTISRVGPEVHGVRVGDRVMAFASAAFASHVVIRGDLVLPVPERVDLKAAATIPVAFLTAWYGLVTQARLRRDEWVLIHGAAGGVGLAALQIAKWLGARIVATAGTPEKRALARLAGADLVFDSRSLSFVDDIRASIGGVDVVLNSLAGEAMARSITVLKPFGRFVELGKRDYIGNTEIGLRPFARNLSYFGVDTDQLIAARPDALNELFADLIGRFADGTFTPLPYREFPAVEAPEAFRLMQGAGHVGKILLTPPLAPPPLAAPAPAFRAAADGVHVVVGGTGGFGFETALWLAEHGATALVVASRSGALAPEAAARVAALSARGITVEVARLDVRDAAACQAFIDDLVARFGRVAGLVHTAMVLDDGLLRDLDRARMLKVLEPKMDGASHLDAATRNLDLDYFVMFSSATTLVGNPGQGNYVAANAFLEGVARRRRAAGRAGLAVAWGAIADVGVLARETAINEKLKRRIGRHAMTAATALGHLGQLLALPAAEQPAVVTCSYIDWASAGELRVVKAPTFSGLMTGGGERSMGQTSDLEHLIAGQSDQAARLTIARLLAEEIGKILRLPHESIDLTRPLTDIGMDSLMSLELDMEVQRRFGVELPVLALGAGSTLMDVAEKVLQRVRGAEDMEGDAAAQVIAEAGIMEKHVNLDLDAATLERLSAKVVSEREHAGEGLL